MLWISHYTSIITHMYFIQTSLCLYDIATLPSLYEDKNNTANYILASYIRPPTHPYHYTMLILKMYVTYRAAPLDIKCCHQWCRPSPRVQDIRNVQRMLQSLPTASVSLYTQASSILSANQWETQSGPRISALLLSTLQTWEQSSRLDDVFSKHQINFIESVKGGLIYYLLWNGFSHAGQ